MLIVVLNLVMPTQHFGNAEAMAIQAAITCLAHFLIILLLLRRFSRSAILAQGGAVLLTNVIVAAVMLSTLSA
jgi:hypothetical protein